MWQYHYRRVLDDLVQILLQPVELCLAYHKWRALRVVQTRHLAHALLAARPFVIHPFVECQDAVQYYKMYALVVETVVVGFRLCAPVLTQVLVVVMFAMT